MFKIMLRICVHAETPVTMSSLPKTRSGRHVIPQLAWWTGQRVTIDPNNYTVDITPGTPDTLCPVVPSNQVVQP